MRGFGLDAPEHAVARLVNLPRAQDRNVARQRLLHDVLAPVELAYLALGAALENLARGIEPDGDVAALQEGVYTRRPVSYLKFRCGCSLGKVGRGVLTRSCGSKERRNACASSAYPLSQRPLRAQLDADLASEVLALEHLVIAQEGEHEARELPRLDEGRQPALALLAGVVGDGG